ncbi:Stk31, partial [Columba guinea]
CQVLYIDYGNSEVLNRSDIVEIPPNLQSPSVAKKYRLWGLQIPTDQNLNMFDQGKKFLSSLVFEKEIRIRHKAKHEDGTIIAQAEFEKTDIGEEVAKAGFAEKCTSPGNTKDAEDRKVDVVQNQHRKIKVPVPLWVNRSDHALYSIPRGRLDQVAASARNHNITGNLMFGPKEKTLACTSVPDTSLAQTRAGQKLSDEKEILRKENLNLMQRQKELELKVQELKCELQKEKEASRKTAESFEETLRTYIGTKMRSLAAKVKSLKEVRHMNKNTRSGEQLSQAIKAVTEGCLTAPCSLEKLQKIWTEYDLAQDRIQLCRNVDERDELITKRDEVQRSLYSAVEELILEVDQLPLTERSRTLQELSASLEMVYGQGSEADDSEEVFQQFLEWKSGKMKKLVCVRNDTDTALQILADWFGGILKCFDLMSEASSDLEEAVSSADEILKKVELAICEELDTDLNEHDEAEKRIIMSAYNKVVHNIRQEQSLIAAIQKRYLASVENENYTLTLLFLIQSDDYSECEMTRIKEEIADLRNRVLQEISKEQEEYEKLTYLVQKWFPELPLLYPEAGILNYMNSGGLLACSLERDLLDAEPMKELSTKRPLVCSEIQGQKVLLKSDPLIYLMVPYYPGASLGALQADTPLTLEETLKVMKGVAQGLQTLHGANIVHGSLHGNNVFVVNRKQGIVGDFDFTKSEEERAAANTMVVSTLSLVSPELKMGQPASPASDMYAYGCLLFWLCIQNQEFGLKEDGTPEVDVVVMDDKVKSLLVNLFCCNRLTAEQVLRDDCFLTVGATPVSPQPGEEHEPCEEPDSEKTDENVIN